MVEINKILGTIQEAIEIEKFGYDFYSNMRLFVKDPDGHRLISNIAKLEIDHIKWLEEEYNRQYPKMYASENSDQIGISIEGKSEIFFKDKNIDVFQNFEAKAAVKFAINIEKRSMEFYKQNIDLTNDQDLKILFNKLAEFEKEHISVLSETLKSLETENKWSSPSIHVHW
jgi:rubrerythrin